MATQKELATHIDLSVTRIKQLQNTGVIPSAKGGPGGYDLDACRLSYIRYIRALASGKIKTDPTNQSEEKTRLITAQADRAELDLEIARGDFVPVDLVSEKWAKIATDFRSRMLSIPSRMIAKTLALKKPAAIDAAFKELVIEALADVSGVDQKPKKKKEKKKCKSKSKSEK